MTDILKIVSLTNCGVLIRTERTAILIDGICEETEHFDGLNAEIYQKMIHRRNPFQRIDYILHTHNHKDHFDCNRVSQYIATRKISGLFLPKDPTQEIRELLLNVRKNKIQLVAPGFHVDGIGKWIMGDVLLTYFNIAHSGKEYENVNHYAFLIEASNRKIYFSGDSAFNDDSQTKALNSINVDIAFYNPYHLNSPSGRKIISEINAKINYIYHIPPEEKDNFNIRRQALRNIRKYQNVLPQTNLILSNNLYLYP